MALNNEFNSILRGIKEDLSCHYILLYLIDMYAISKNGLCSQKPEKLTNSIDCKSTWELYSFNLDCSKIASSTIQFSNIL